MAAIDVKQKYTGKIAAGYDAKRSDSEKWIREQDAVAKLIPFLKGTVLDIPLGTGRFLPLYEQYGLDVIGIDTSEDMLAIARRKGKVSAWVGDIFDIRLMDASVDATVCTRMLNWLNPDEMRAAIIELSRVTRDAVIFSVTCAPEIVFKAKGAVIHARKEFDTAVESVGFVLSKQIVHSSAGREAIVALYTR